MATDSFGTNANVGNPKGFGRVRDLGTRMNGAMNEFSATSKRIEETAGWVAVTLACVAVVSIAALGLAVIALIGTRSVGKSDD